jgi:hypothetical protein
MGIQFLDVAASHLDPAGGGLDDPVDHLKDGRLPTTRRPHERRHPAGGHLHNEVLYRRGGRAGIPLGDVIEPNPRFAHLAIVPCRAANRFAAFRPGNSSPMSPEKPVADTARVVLHPVCQA